MRGTSSVPEHNLPSDVDPPLRGLVAEAADFVQHNPDAAAAGRWWLSDPANQRYRSLPEAVTIRHAAVLVLMWQDDDGPRLLLTERSAALAKHPGQIAFPGGGAEEFDLDTSGTALREAQEEVGLDPAGVEVLGPLPPALIPVSGFSVTPVLAVAEDPGVLTPYAGEVARVIRAPVADLVAPAHRYMAVIDRDGMRAPTPAFYFGGGTADAAFVWGFTGILLDRMLQRLGWAQEWDEARVLDPRRFKR